MDYYTRKHDSELDKITIYSKYPQLKPFIGSEFGIGCPRILLIAESHYLPPNSKIHLEPKDWYTGDDTHLTYEEKKWISTRGILNKPYRGWKSRGHTIYRNIESALVNAGMPINDSVFRNIAFMNAFQRPAKTGDSINSTLLDNQISIDTVSNVINTIEPDHVIFLSTKARKAIGKELGVKALGVHHPASPWWNRKKNNTNSKEIFIREVSNYIKNKKD